jgi:imidazolonepropionase-like amidohydrolase
VKFALGENVKQANWGDRYTKRYPQTRMGVEQIMRDTFLAAQDYEQALADFKQGKRVYPPSPDLRLQTALEILHNQRLVHIHSYRQDEILMFARLSQDLGFTIGTFQHVLEGYKVADTLAKIKAGGSTFSDWFNFKYEVIDAIPYNASLLDAAGVVTSLNSDSNELARHLNTEAAKAVKYGGMAPAEALKLVTLNPARQLRIDQQTGSLEKGKDADFVVWSDSPLSAYARVEQTWIDGRNYFSIKGDQALREASAREHERLIGKALPERLDEIGLGELPDEGNKKTEKAKTPKDVDWLRLEAALHYADERRGLYDNGRDKHNCVTTRGRGY